MRSESACRASVACGTKRLLWRHPQPAIGLQRCPVGRQPLRPRARCQRTGPWRRRRHASGSAWPSETGHGRRRQAARRCPQSRRSVPRALRRGRQRRRASRQLRQRAALLGARCLGRGGQRSETQWERPGSLVSRPSASRARMQAAAQRGRGHPPAGRRRTRRPHSRRPWRARRRRPACADAQRARGRGCDALQALAVGARPHILNPAGPAGPVAAALRLGRLRTRCMRRAGGPALGAHRRSACTAAACAGVLSARRGRSRAPCWEHSRAHGKRGARQHCVRGRSHCTRLALRSRGLPRLLAAGRRRHGRCACSHGRHGRLRPRVQAGV
jgi:hypothetical protein